MTIDEISTRIIAIALYLDLLAPGSVTEIWIDEQTIQKIKSELPSGDAISAYIYETKLIIGKLTEKRRKKYLQEILHSLEYQIQHHAEKIPYETFSVHVFGVPIKRVTQKELDSLQEIISTLEKKCGKSRMEVCNKYSIQEDQYVHKFNSYIQEIRQKLPSYIIPKNDLGFTVEVTHDKPWSAFNLHTQPFASKLLLNADNNLTEIDLHRLACHEAYGGHHSELCNKDGLLTEQKRGEHGLVITFSPQVFVSEAIAEGIFQLLKVLDTSNSAHCISWHYTRLIFALQNLSSFMYFDDGLSRDEIDEILKQYAVSDDTRSGILNFSCDPIYGKYAPVYFSAYNFIEKLYSQTPDKKKLLDTLFFQPCTPSILQMEFNITIEESE